MAQLVCRVCSFGPTAGAVQVEKCNVFNIYYRDNGSTSLEILSRRSIRLSDTLSHDKAPAGPVRTDVSSAGGPSHIESSSGPSHVNRSPDPTNSQSKPPPQGSALCAASHSATIKQTPAVTSNLNVTDDVENNLLVEQQLRIAEDCCCR